MKLLDSRLEQFAVGMILLYPIMVVSYVPFGGGIRYYSVLLPIAMLLLCIALRKKSGLSFLHLMPDFIYFIKPFLPFVLALFIVGIVHDYYVFFINVMRAVVYAALLYALLVRADLNWRKIVFTSAFACFLFAAVAIFEVVLQGRARAWGGVYENTFGQFAVLCSGVSLLAGVGKFVDTKSRFFLLAAFFAGIFAAVLSGSRGALLPLCGVFLGFIFYSRFSRRVAIFACSLILLFCYFDFFGFYTRLLLSGAEVKSYFMDGHIVESSVGIRLELWRMAFYSLLHSSWLGLGVIHFKEMAVFFPDLNAGASYMDYYFGLSGSSSPWLFHGDLPQIMVFGGWSLLIGFFASVILLIRFSCYNKFALWAIFCGAVWGISELFVFNRISFGLVLINMALFCAWQNSHRKSQTLGCIE